MPRKAELGEGGKLDTKTRWLGAQADSGTSPSVAWNRCSQLRVCGRTCITCLRSPGPPSCIGMGTSCAAGCPGSASCRLGEEDAHSLCTHEHQPQDAGNRGITARRPSAGGKFCRVPASGVTGTRGRPAERPIESPCCITARGWEPRPRWLVKKPP